MVQEISKVAASARSIIHKKVRESRSAPTQPSKQIKADTDSHASNFIHQHATIEENETSVATESAYSVDNTKQSIKGN